ncbi:MAG: IS5/IS1182 family transposase, partial [Zoogloeaceae bacterium]|nr:IS5/IS1182 family transposase [Zoogloeaceae bacterium]
MNATRDELLLQRWHVVQQELIPGLRQEAGGLTPKLERL